MYNRNSAIQRIKNHLAYKLGQAMIDSNTNGGGYITLCKKLYLIKKQHKKEQKIYQETIQVFPQLQYPALETCSDYEQALKYKFHLSYMLGKVLIKAYRTWYKGGVFKLKNDIKRANKEFQIFKEIFKEFHQINVSMLQGLIKNKQLLLKEFQRIKNILKIHQDYKAILDNIFHNFIYFIQNFDLIEEWLLSDDFYEKYKKENHPYPSLLDPKKLNDENEKINYHTIPAELAWEMNLPLPNNYEFVWLFRSCSGSEAMYVFFEYLNIQAKAYAWESAIKMYSSMYSYLLKDMYNIVVLPTITTNWYNSNYNKIFYMVQKKSHFICVYRDPISRIKTALNHIDNDKVNSNITHKMQHLNLTVNYSNSSLFPKISYIYSNMEKPTYESINKILINKEFYFTSNKIFNMMKTYIMKIDCLEFSEINTENAINTFEKLSKKYNFKLLNNQDIFKTRINNYEGLVHLPVSVYAHPYDLNNVFGLHINSIENNESLKMEGGINIYITTLSRNYDFNKYENISKFFKQCLINLKDIIILVKKEDLLLLKNNKDLFQASQIYIKGYLKELNTYIQNIKNNLINENLILNYLKKNKNIGKELKKLIDEDLIYIKNYHSNFILKWKYYQEFEKMCEELDG